MPSVTPKATHPNTAVDVLAAIVARDGVQTSPTTTARHAAGPFARLQRAARARVGRRPPPRP